MNKQRRKNINEIIPRIETLMQELEYLKEDVDTILSEEQEYLDNIPENLQGSERYEIAESAISNLEDSMDQIDDAIAALEESKTHLEDATA